MATNDEYAMLSGPVPAGFAVYQLPGIQLGDHTYYGWKMVKQKSESYTDEDGKEQTRQVDDDTAAAVYDGTTQLIQSNASLLKSNASQQLVNAQLLTSVANQQLVNAQVMKQLAAQLGGEVMNIFGSLVKQYYQAGIYSETDLPLFIQCGWITADDYKSLTGKDYSAPATAAETAK